MSNIIKAINFLKGQPDKRFIVVTNDNLNVGSEQIYLKDIPNEDLAAYIKFNIGPTNEKKLVWVECRKFQGATHVKVDGFSIEIAPSNPIPAPTNQPVQNAQVMQPEQNNNFQFLGNPNGGNQIFGLGVAQVMEMQRNTDRLGDVKDMLEETKNELKQVRHEKNLLEIDHRNAVTKLATAEAQKEMAVLMVKNENKSFFDSKAFENLMDKAPDMLEKMAAMKSGNFTTGAEQLGNPNISSVKSGFIEIVTDDLDDQEVILLGQICGQIKNPIFVKSLIQLIQSSNAN